MAKAMPQHLPDAESQAVPELRYDTPLGVGQVRVHHMGDGRLAIQVGPPGVRKQLLRLAPLTLLFGFLCTCLGLLTVGLVARPGAIPYNKLLFVPTLVAWGFCGLEMLSAFRNWSQPAQLEVDRKTFRCPFPHPQSEAEEVPTRLVCHLKLVQRRSRVLRQQTESLEVGIEHGAHFLIFTGYPHETLEKLTEVLGPALGLTVDDSSGA
jgi:hypothetical protein